MRQLIIIIMACCSYAQLAEAQGISFVYPSNDNIFSIQDSSGGYASLAEKAKWLYESGEPLKPEEAYINRRGYFEKFAPFIQKPGWVKVGVFNATYHPKHLILSFGMVNLAEVWLLHENGGVEKQVGGLTKQGNWPEGWHDGSAIMQLDIPERHTVMVLARITPDLSQTSTMHISIEDMLRWEESRNNSRHWLQAGGIALMLGASIALPAWLLKKDTLHGWFLAMIMLLQVFVTIQYGLWSHLFWIGQPQIDQMLSHVILWLIPFAYWNYMQKVLSWKHSLPFIWASARVAICAALWLGDAPILLHWFEQPSYLIDFMLFFMLIRSHKENINARMKYWALGSSLFWVGAVFNWMWLEWWYDGFYRPDLQTWELASWAILIVYLVISLPQKKSVLKY